MLMALALGAGSSVPAARGQVFGASPRTIRIIQGFPAGGTGDAVVRIITPHLEKSLGARIVVEYKPGAGGRTANAHAKSAKPDGNTLVLCTSSLMAVYPFVFNHLPYDPLHDFVPVTSIVDLEFGYVASTAAAPGVKTLGDYVQWVKSDPGHSNCGSPASGSIPHFLGAILAQSAGIQLNHVSFNGSAPHLQALNGGQIPFGVEILAGIVPHLASGRVRLLATSGAQRSMQGVPTVGEAGFPDLTTEDYAGFFYPAHTPSDRVQQLQAAVKDALRQPAVQERLRHLTFRPSGAETAQFAQRVRADYDKWRQVVANSGFRPLD
ncbi:tripartite tricarboxylate transporter substrate-binding protein [Variovorax sp. RA8]|uniref:tripartite tricarboxylate transporter substrate-binding protein n=1 Tax=Variovorax sp. (strain JCM 16519 / RA8) TaxID=662548 RepID=UPI001315F816|nr:tripartite tricarboxylate transporter substrate-binding protein [Variovorax sp. RA8]VTU30742.1 Argininosuccinate lyase [Variovorax sp. RA8]